MKLDSLFFRLPRITFVSGDSVHPESLSAGFTYVSIRSNNAVFCQCGRMNTNDTYTTTKKNSPGKRVGEIETVRCKAVITGITRIN